jgi:hypothetical protein
MSPPVMPAGFSHLLCTVAQQAHVDAHASRKSALWIRCGYAADSDGAGSGPRVAHAGVFPMRV